MPATLTPDDLITLLHTPPDDLEALLLQNLSILTQLAAVGHTPLHYLALLENSNALSKILPHIPYHLIDVTCQSGDQHLQTPLHWACVSGPLSAVRLFIRHGADLVRRDGRGYDALIHASQYGRVDVVHLLGASSSASEWRQFWEGTDKRGCSALLWAAYYDHVGVVRYLLGRGVSIDMQDEMGVTALYRAAIRDNFAVVDMLLRFGADYEMKDSQGRGLLQIATGRSRAIILNFKRKKEKHWRQTWVVKHAFVWFYYIILFISYSKYNQIQRQGIPIGIDVIAHMFFILSLISHSQSTYRDPGIIQKGTEETFLNYIERSIEENRSDTRLLPSAYCFTCLVERPERSKHSRERDACIRRFDHECPWVNNTIGLRTHKPLIVLLITTAISEIFFVYFTAKQVGALAYKIGWQVFLQKPISLMLILVHMLICCFSLMLFATQMQLICRGRTTYEHLVAMREKSQHAYDRGCGQNLWAFIMSSGPGTTAKYMTAREELLSVVVGGGTQEKENQRA